MTTKLVAAAALASFWGCSTLVPGLRMDEDKVEKRGKASDPDYKLETITPQVLVRLAEERAKNRPPPDPMGNVAPGPYTVAPYDVLGDCLGELPPIPRN